MYVSRVRPSGLRAFALLAVVLTNACHATPFEVPGAPSRSFSIAVGETMTIDIGGIGPPYANPPTITGLAIEFVDMTHPSTTVSNPGGVLQLYHFKGIASGQAIITFQNQISPSIVDTVNVR